MAFKIAWSMQINRIHCSYHKCLTKYFKKVFGGLQRALPIKNEYRHFNSRIDEFYRHYSEYKITSVNNHFLQLNKLGDYRITRFIRDPRDLVVSGYFYHLKGVEQWCNIINPQATDLAVVNGNIPEAMGAGHSFSSYLSSLPEEDGLIAEMEFRKLHFQSMLQWPKDNPNIRLFRYENILGQEKEVFREIADFYHLSWLEKKAAGWMAERFSAKKRTGKIEHIRNPQSGQWKKHFTPRVEKYFEREYGELLTHYDY